MSRALEPELRQGLAELGLALDDEQVAALLDYLALIRKWGKVYNLTAVRDPSEMLTHHLLDSLALIPALRRHTGSRAARLLDVGSGAGLPGVVIAIACAEIRVDCVDTVAKKAAFVQQVAATLRLPNLAGVHARVENLADPYDLIVSRAFASLTDFVSWSRNALGPEGAWIAMKGKHPAGELVALPVGVEVFHVEQIEVPALAAERCLIWLKPAPAVT